MKKKNIDILLLLIKIAIQILNIIFSVSVLIVQPILTNQEEIEQEDLYWEHLYFSFSYAKIQINHYAELITLSRVYNSAK